MRIVEQARLGFREGTSDKVYEVDIVEVAAEQYVVNFRFGRRGSSLRDGTKTPLPVSLEKARAVYTALVAEKTNAGYKPLSEAVVGSASPSAVDPRARAARRERELISELGRGHRSEQPLHLLVRKAGERGLQEAEPVLLELLSGTQESRVKPEVLRHFIVAALARCGSSRAVPALSAICEDVKQPRHLRDVALLALTSIGGAQARQKVRARVPVALRPEPGGELAAYVRAAEALLEMDPEQARSAIFALYASAPARLEAAETEEDRWARSIVLAVVRIARPLKIEPGLLHSLHFAAIKVVIGLLRSLNWAAEIRRDAELFAALTRRFETERRGAKKTKAYFRRRAARALRRLGSIASPDYVEFATALASSYDDSHAEPVRDGVATWDAFARYHALNFILYGNSPRYERAGHRRATWRCSNGYVPNSLPPAVREESFPQLWDQAPEALWRLGVSAAASPVIHFATRALRDQTEFLSHIEDARLAQALAYAKRPMQLVAFEAVRVRSPNLVLARAALLSELDEADSWVLRWVEASPRILSEQVELLALMITAPSERVREASTRLAGSLSFFGDLARELVSSTIALLISFSNELSANERAEAAAAYLLRHAAEALDALGVEVVKDLLSHSLPGVAALGAEVLLRRSRSGTIADQLLDVLLESPHAYVRAIGARVVADTPPALMKDEPELLLHLALSSNVELRVGTRSLLGEVARLYPEVGARVASDLVDSLLTAQAEGVPAHIVSLLRHELKGCLPKRAAASVLSLVGALSPHAREAGGLLLGVLSPDELELEQIVRLASHEILLVRQGAWALALAARDRFRVAPVALARLCDARWDDSRAFAFEFVRSFAHEDLVPDTLIAICDSIEPHVQRFGQTLLLEYWREQDAPRYLLRLSEHPSENIQLLVSGLLDRYARGNRALLEQLLPCFRAVLSRVNQGAVAKERVLAFLRAEATASADTALLVAPLLERQSLTRAISHKGSLIAAMVAVHERYPEVPLPISLAPVSLHSRSRRGI